MESRLLEIKERLRVLLPGAWKAIYSEHESFNPESPDEDPCICTANGQFIAQTTYDMQSFTCRPTMYADTEFIAHAKEDISWLLEQLEIKRIE